MKVTWKSLLLSGVITLLLGAGAAQASPLTILNASFETGADGSAVIAGWIDSDPANPGFWLDNDGVDVSPNDPNVAADGQQWISANRLAGGAGAQPATSTLSQTVSVLGDAGLIASGATINLDFAYSDEDNNDKGIVSLDFLDATNTIIGSLTTGDIPNTAAFSGGFDGWASLNLSGSVPAATAAVTINLTTTRSGGSATNIFVDDFSGAITAAIPEPASYALLGVGCAALVGLRRRQK